MRLLIYTPVFPPLSGGIETVTMELARGLATMPPSSPDADLEVIVVTPHRGVADNERDLPFKLIRNPSLAKLVNLIWSADILHIAGPQMGPLILGWILRKPVVVEHHGFQTACPNGQMIYRTTQTACPGHFMAGNYMECVRCNSEDGTIRSLKAWLLTFPRRWLSERAKSNVTPTAWLGDVVQLPRMVTIHHGLPHGGAIMPVEPDVPKIVFVGRLVSTKGVHVLLKAVSFLRDHAFRLEVIGEGPERENLEEEVRGLHLEDRVVFRGFLATDDAEELLASARAIVMPSLAGEVFGLVALENMMRKKAVIISDIGALAEVVGDAGLVFPVGNAEILADRIKQVLQPGYAETLEERAGKRAKLFTTQRMAEEHRALYARVLHECTDSDQYSQEILSGVEAE